MDFRAVHRGSFFVEMRTTEARQLLPDAWGNFLHENRKWTKNGHMPNSIDLFQVSFVQYTRLMALLADC